MRFDALQEFPALLRRAQGPVWLEGRHCPGHPQEVQPPLFSPRRGGRGLGRAVRDAYDRTAVMEYNDPKRIGYQYFGAQADGSYLQWPAVQWCPKNYDPRFRDWYAGTVSGPKDPRELSLF